MMKVLGMLALLIMFMPTMVRGGEIYGDLRERKKPVGENVRIEIRCQKDTYSGETDKYGSYRIFVGENGRCWLSVPKIAGSVETEVYSYDDSVRYDLEVMQRSDGKYEVRRR